MTGGLVLRAILLTIGELLLILAGVAVLLILLVLLVPIRYQMAGWIEDPEGEETLDSKAILQKAGGELRFSWLLHLFRGKLCWNGQWELKVHVFCFPIPVKFGKKDSGKDKPEQAKPEQEKTQKGESKHKITKEQLREIPGILRKDETKQAIRAILNGAGKALRLVLPRKWQIGGTVGLGGIENTVKMMEVEGVLLPFVCGHVWILPQMEGWRFDLQGAAKGRISLWGLVTALVILLLNADVQRLIGDVQRVLGSGNRTKKNKKSENQKEKPMQKAA